MTLLGRLGRVRGLHIPLAGMLSACAPDSPRPVHQLPPPLGDLQIMSRLMGTPGNPLVDAVPVDSCRILVADLAGGLTMIWQDGRVSKLATIPGDRRIHLEPADEGQAIAWADGPPWLARIHASPFRIDSLSIPTHPWNGRFVGPAVSLGDQIAVAPLANPEFAHDGPVGAPDAPLIELLSSSSPPITRTGPRLSAADDYGAWRQWRGELGRVAEGLLFVSFADGVLHRFAWNGDVDDRPVQLPVYFRAVEPQIRVLRFPWIQFGNFPYFMDTPQLTSGTFTPGGTLFAIRPYNYRWAPRPNRFVPDAGVWQPSSEGLEVYAADGELLSAFALPAGVRTVQANSHGPLLLLADTAIFLTQSPLTDRAECHYPSGVISTTR